MKSKRKSKKARIIIFILEDVLLRTPRTKSNSREVQSVAKCSKLK